MEAGTYVLVVPHVNLRLLLELVGIRSVCNAVAPSASTAFSSCPTALRCCASTPSWGEATPCHESTPWVYTQLPRVYAQLPRGLRPGARVCAQLPRAYTSCCGAPA
jgi:hypothetical protein